MIAGSVRQSSAPGACAACLRRSWLLASLSGVLDYAGRTPTRLLELLALSDEQLLQALAGRRRTELRARYEHFEPSELQLADDVEGVCLHDPHYPCKPRGTAPPSMLHVLGGARRLHELTSRPVVAMLGTRRATDYGLEIAKSIARGLAAAGVTVASSLADGIAVAAQTGALQSEGRTLIALGGGANVCSPAKRRSLHERVGGRGCIVAELPCGSAARRWGALAGERTLVSLAQLTLVVEADERPSELACAQLALASGAAVAAVPGRVTSPASRGTNALLIGGARLVRGPTDVLELLYTGGAQETAPPPPTRARLEPRLRSMLELIGAGRDTPERLIGAGLDAGEALLALSELELLGLLARGDGGRYVPREPLPARAVRYRVERQMEP